MRAWRVWVEYFLHSMRWLAKPPSSGVPLRTVLLVPRREGGCATEGGPPLRHCGQACFLRPRNMHGHQNPINTL